MFSLEEAIKVLAKKPLKFKLVFLAKLIKATTTTIIFPFLDRDAGCENNEEITRARNVKNAETDHAHVNVFFEHFLWEKMCQQKKRRRKNFIETDYCSLSPIPLLDLDI